MDRIVWCLILAAIFFVPSNAQRAGWSKPKALTCFLGLAGSTKNLGYEKAVNQYEWVGRVTNNYDRTVTFDMSLTIGVQKQIIGQFTLKPEASTFAQSFYYNTSSTDSFIEVENVCFGTRDKAGSCSNHCFAQCDAGSPNQPNCGGDRDNDEQAKTDREDAQSTAKNGDSATRAEHTANSNASVGNSVAKRSSKTSTNPPKAAVSAFASSIGEIERQIIANLDANIPRDEKYVAMYSGQGEKLMTFGRVARSSTGEGLTFSFNARPEVGNQPTPDWIPNAVSYAFTFDQMASSLFVGPFPYQYGNPYLNLLAFQHVLHDGCQIKGLRNDGGAATHCAQIPYKVGANQKNLNELKALLQQLVVARRSASRPDSSIPIQKPMPISRVSAKPIPKSGAPEPRPNSAKDLEDEIKQLSETAASQMLDERYSLAISTYKQVIEKAPRNAIAHYWLGYCYMELEMLESAIPVLKRSVALKPDLADSYNLLGFAYAMSKRSKEAIPFFNKAIQLAPNNPEPYLGLSGVQKDLGLFREAIRNAETSLKLKPAGTDKRFQPELAYFVAGFSYCELGDKENAMKQYETLVRVIPELAERLLEKINGIPNE